ncbi:MAG: hypothetical protein AAFN41_01880, partial [Planctomycetota bacterium]
ERRRGGQVLETGQSFVPSQAMFVGRDVDIDHETAAQSGVLVSASADFGPRVDTQADIKACVLVA